MTSFTGMLEARAFASLWYWLFLALCWVMATRTILGVPPLVAMRAKSAARKDGEADDGAADGDVHNLLDWLAVTLPVWRMGRADSIILSALIGMVLSFFVIAGFSLGYQTAQAASLLLVPLTVLLILKTRLAGRLDKLLIRALAGEVPAKEAARIAATSMIRHRWLAFALALVSIFATTLWGSLWILMHPFGV